MRERKQLLHRLWKVISTRTFAICALFAVTAGIVFQIASSTYAVFIRDEEDVSVRFTFQKDIAKILDKSDRVTLSTDVVETLGFYGGRYAEINITRSFPVAVTADGVTKEVMVANETVSELLEREGLAFDSNDAINLPLPKPLEEGDHVILQRVDYTTRTVNEDIPYEVVEKPTSLIPRGSSRLLQAGQNGQKATTYMVRTVDGQVEEETVVAEDIISHPVNQVILLGENAPISNLDFGVPMSGGKPTSYQWVKTGAIATGYSAGVGARGASGLRLSPGYVAVNPNVIPYGSRLYITSADNRFVYGYAIAADTGTGLMNGVIDVDLYYDTYLESCLNGRRSVNIYVL